MNDRLLCLRLLDEFHGFCIHREGRLCLLGTFLQCIATFNERHHSIQVVNRLLKSVHLHSKRKKMVKKEPVTNTHHSPNAFIYSITVLPRHFAVHLLQSLGFFFSAIFHTFSPTAHCIPRPDWLLILTVNLCAMSRVQNACSTPNLHKSSITTGSFSCCNTGLIFVQKFQLWDFKQERKAWKY